MWQPWEEKTLKRLYLNRVQTDKIAEMLGRTKRAIECRTSHLGLKRGKPSYETHGWCTIDGWILLTDVEDRYCPMCGRQIRTSGRG